MSSYNIFNNISCKANWGHFIKSIKGKNEKSKFNQKISIIKYQFK